jgi:hypothetical protein
MFKDRVDFKTIGFPNPYSWVVRGPVRVTAYCSHFSLSSCVSTRRAVIASGHRAERPLFDSLLGQKFLPPSWEKSGRSVMLTTRLHLLQGLEFVPGTSAYN